MAEMVKRKKFLDGEVLDLSEQIALTSPTDTPLSTLILGRGAVVPAKDITVTWRERKLNEDKGTLKLEGAEAGEVITSTRGSLSNVCQIIEKVTQVSGTAQALNPLGIGNSFTAEVNDRLVETKRDMEWYFLNGTKTLEQDTTPRQMNGLLNLVNTENVIDATDTGLTEDLLLDALQKMWNHGAQGEYFTFVNATVKRLINKLANLTNEGVMVAYRGETGYSEAGATSATITKGTTEYPSGTKVQTMVEQPLFYTKVVPVKSSVSSSGRGKKYDKARFYISPTPKAGFKPVDGFLDDNGILQDKIYLSAFEGSIFDTSAGAYLKADEQVADFATDMLSSIAGAKPASGLTQNLTRANVRKLCTNRGKGWKSHNIFALTATQWLILVEYASMNAQSVIGQGVSTFTDDGSTKLRKQLLEANGGHTEADLQRELSRKSKLLDAYLDGILNKQEYQKKAEELDERIIQLKAETEKNKANSGDIAEIDKVLANIDEEVSRYVDGNEKLKVEYLLEHLEQVQIFPDKVIVIVPILSEGIVVEKTQYVSREKRSR